MMYNKMNFGNRIDSGRPQIQQRLGFQPKRQYGNFGNDLKTHDARLKLISKKRQTMKDARDKLAELARVSDAREKINKLKATQNTNKVSVNGAQQKVNEAQQKVNEARMKKLNFLQRKNIASTNVGKNSINGINTKSGMKKIILNTGLKGKTEMQAGTLKRTVSGGTKAAGIMKSKSSSTLLKKMPLIKSSGERFHPLPNNPNVVTIKNDRVHSSRPMSNILDNRSRPQLKGKSFFQSSSSAPLRNSSAPMRNSLSSRDLFPSESLNKTFKSNAWDFNQGPYSSMVDEIKPTRLKITTPNNYMNYNQMEETWEMQAASRMPSMKRGLYQNYDDYAPQAPPKKQALLSTNIISRLDQSYNQPNPGFKVVVTNLHPVVTVDDVEELFRNIGPIRYARMVRDGMAEVIFDSEMDAYRSVDVYHNRQLDGQAMNVSVVNNKSSYMQPEPLRYNPLPPRSEYNPAPPPSRRSYSDIPSNSRMPPMTKSVLRTAGGGAYGSQDSGTSSVAPAKRYQKVDVSPDIGAIHHALFSGKNSNSNSNLQVYVKLPKSHIRGGK